MWWKFYLIFMVFMITFNSSNGFDYCPKISVTALILARGGSKGIKDKNLIEINGVSLLGRTISVIKSTKLFESVWVSTDSKKIANEALKYGALVHKRSALYAKDETSSMESVQEFLKVHKAINNFALFQCTSVFLRSRYIVDAFQLLNEHDCIFTVKRSHHLRWTQQNGTLTPLNFDPVNRPRRQDWEGEYIETGMFYFTTKELIAQNRFQNERCAMIEIDEKDALEIDKFEDIVLARCLENFY